MLEWFSVALTSLYIFWLLITVCCDLNALNIIFTESAVTFTGQTGTAVNILIYPSPLIIQWIYIQPLHLLITFFYFSKWVFFFLKKKICSFTYICMQALILIIFSIFPLLYLITGNFKLYDNNDLILHVLASTDCKSFLVYKIVWLLCKVHSKLQLFGFRVHNLFST